jgi:hypothetical protein
MLGHLLKKSLQIVADFREKKVACVLVGQAQFSGNPPAPPQNLSSTSDGLSARVSPRFWRACGGRLLELKPIPKVKNKHL